MIHNLLIIKNDICICNYKTGTRLELELDLVDGLLEAIFGVEHLFFRKKINYIFFLETKIRFRALSKSILLGIIEDIEDDKECGELLLKEISKALNQTILILEHKIINPISIKRIPAIKEEIVHTIERALRKTPCAFLRKKLLRKKCTFVDKSLERPPLFCNQYELKTCPYLQNERLWQIYRTPFKLNNGMQVGELVKKLGRWNKIEKYSLHVFDSNNGTTAMELRSKLKAYEINVSPKKAFDLMLKLEEKGFITRGSPPIYEHH